jgi:hypothetical protein
MTFKLHQFQIFSSKIISIVPCYGNLNVGEINNGGHNLRVLGCAISKIKYLP